MIYPALTIACAFIHKAKSERRDLIPIKLLQLVYLAHAWNLALENQPLINEPVLVWPFGPVIESLFHTFKKYGNDPIEKWPMLANYKSLKALSEDHFTRALLQQIWEVYGKLTAVQLANLTHEKKSPWAMARRKGYWCIPESLLREYYINQIEKIDAEDA